MLKNLGLCIPKKNAEEAIFLIKDLKLLDRNLKIDGIESGVVILPIVRKPSRDEFNTLNTNIRCIKLVTHNFLETRRSETVRDVLKDNLPPQILNKIPKSVDVIGDIAVIRIQPELISYKKLLGDAILKVNRNVSTILAKMGPVEGDLRLRDFEIISGNKKTVTVHKENGCIFHVDPTLVYFSPRLSYEHNRVAQQVKDGELVIDMFAGVGPFSIQIAKKNRLSKIFAIDLNPEAYNFLEKNVLSNKVGDAVIPILGDSRSIINNKMYGVADRTIMNLPEKSFEYVEVACKSLKSEGGIIHYYSFEEEPNTIEKVKTKFREAVRNTGRKLEEFSFARLVRPIAPRKWQVVVDALIY